jgi:hypothetical protein
MSANEMPTQKAKLSDEVQSFYDGAVASMQSGSNGLFNYLETNVGTVNNMTPAQKAELEGSDLRNEIYSKAGMQAAKAYQSYELSAYSSGQNTPDDIRQANVDSYYKHKNGALGEEQNIDPTKAKEDEKQRQDIAAQATQNKTDLAQERPSVKEPSPTLAEDKPEGKIDVEKAKEALADFKTFRNGVGKDDAAALKKIGEVVGIDVDTSKLGKRGLPVGEEKALEEKFKEIIAKDGRITEEDKTKLGAMFADTESKFKGQPSGVEPPAVAKSNGQAVEAGRS